jgi:TonB family protein
MVMIKNAEIRFPLVVWISLFLHAVLLVGILLNQVDFAGRRTFTRSRADEAGGLPMRDIIVNINPDRKKALNRSTLLSDQDSSARGYVSREKGDKWLNNSLEFHLKRGQSRRKASGSSSKQEDNSLLLSKSNEMVVIMKDMLAGEAGESGKGGTSDFTKIPDKYSFTRQNAIYYSNTGAFSFNTMKFKNFQYFKRMKDRIASFWYPPIVANSVFSGYAPGHVRIMAIPSQEVKLYFVLNRKGDVLQVQIVESLGNVALNSSCVEAIRLSRSFGPVPGDIRGELIVIPFIFGFFTR